MPHAYLRLAFILLGALGHLLGDDRWNASPTTLDLKMAQSGGR